MLNTVTPTKNQAALTGLVAAIVGFSLSTWGTEAGSAKAKTPTTTIKAAQAKGEKQKMTTVIVDTSEGKFEIELNSEKAPKSVANFLSYVEKNHYDGTIFHRVINGFMIQGGGFDEKMAEKSTGTGIENEAGNGLKNDRGTVAMARTNVVNSATAQFFVNVADNAFLNHKNTTPQGFGYAVFGKVTSGMDVVDKIKDTPTGNVGQFSDVPKKSIVIKSIRKK